MENELSRERVMVDVWDWQTRVLHWVNATLIIALALLIVGKFGMEYLGVAKNFRAPVRKLHAYVGYVFIITFMLRLFWGFAGNKYARWRDIIPYNARRWTEIAQDVRWYLSFFSGRPANVLGHDPLASLFYIALFVILILQSATGMILSGTEFNMYPGFALTGSMSKDAAESLADFLGTIHEFGFWFILFFFAAHIAGMVAHELKEKPGMFSAMIHGKKYIGREDL